ncbi:hypothetical protein H5410_023178 [Solanum commersonii]|uniref:Putative plant transposon protein domain-containing protein n=1 Tax=Solanum commersonii TaxID=4109 RepID=A0A9J5ZG47_SOLCO|nr:hypothetical protein H5410_023178 [Solanum commersonii]
MTKTRSMTAPKILVNDHCSTKVDYLSLSSDSDIAEFSARPFSSKKRTSSVKKKNCKKARPDPSIPFESEDMHNFWGVEQKLKFEAFKKRPIVPGRVINLELLEDSHCPVISLFRTQKLSLLLRLCGHELYEEPVRLFYANLRVSEDSGDLETLVLGNRIVINDSMFKDVFGSEFFDDLPYMNGVWPENFEVSFGAAKAAVVEPNTDLSNFGPLSLCFENRIIAHIVATTLVPRKGSLSNISTRDVFILYCLVKKYRINWAAWIREYMLKSVEDSNPSASLPYGLLVSRIIVDSLVDLSNYKPVEVNATYDTKTFSSMGYVLVNDKWHKKESLQARAETPKATRVSVDSASVLLQEVGDIKTRLTSLESNVMVMQECLNKILQHSKDTSTDVGKIKLAVEDLKKEGVRTVNRLIKQVDSIKAGVDSSHNELAVSVQTSYSNLSKDVERSYDSFCRNILNTLKYFLGRR